MDQRFQRSLPLQRFDVARIANTSLVVGFGQTPRDEDSSSKARNAT